MCIIGILKYTPDIRWALVHNNDNNSNAVATVVRV